MSENIPEPVAEVLPPAPVAPEPEPVPTPAPVVVTQVNETVTETVNNTVVVENHVPEPASAPVKPKGNFFKRGAAHCYYIAKMIVLLPLFWLRRRQTVDSMRIYSVKTDFFLWSFIVMGSILATTVRVDPLAAGICGWVYAWFFVVFVASVIYDLNAKRLAMWAIIFFAIWMGLQYAQDVKHWIILGAITHHLASLHPQLDPGFASFLSWVFVIPFTYSLYRMVAFGMKRITPNEIIEYHFMEGNELMDRQGIKFKTQYRDLLETILGFGCGDLVALDNHGNEFKRYPNVLFLYFLWPRLERIIEQRAVVEDGSPKKLEQS